MVFLLADEFTGVWRRASIDADAGAAGVLMTEPSATAASSKKLGQTAAPSTTTSATTASAASSSPEQLTEVETLRGCLT
ncbi:MAG TPA: hypothetical protein VKV03_07705 [Candidatus Binataceae bacterium]|nr:hypothetical protein [Candidatus Binataceae bacterium]